MLRTILLQPEYLPGLEVGDLIYVTAHSLGLCDDPALTIGVEDDHFLFVYVQDGKTSQKGQLPIDQYGLSWSVKMENGFSVETPTGMIHVLANSNHHTPGITMSLQLEGEQQAERIFSSAYETAGSFCPDLDSCNLDLPGHICAELLLERVIQENRRPVCYIDDDLAKNKRYQTTAGLVTRVWSEVIPGQIVQKRALYFGYKVCPGEESSLMKLSSCSLDGVKALKCGQPVFVTSSLYVGPYFHTPALVIGCNQNDFVFAFVKDNKEAAQGKLPLSDYQSSKHQRFWEIGRKKGLSVQTPAGLLHAFEIKDEKAPGVLVELYQEHVAESIMLSVTQYESRDNGSYYTTIWPNSIKYMDEHIMFLHKKETKK